MSSLLLSIRPTEMVKHHFLTTSLAEKAKDLAQEIWSEVFRGGDPAVAAVEGSRILSDSLREEVAILAEESPSPLIKLLVFYAMDNLVQWQIVGYPFFCEFAQREAVFQTPSYEDTPEEELEALSALREFSVMECIDE